MTYTSSWVERVVRGYGVGVAAGWWGCGPECGSVGGLWWRVLGRIGVMLGGSRGKRWVQRLSGAAEGSGLVPMARARLRGEDGRRCVSM